MNKIPAASELQLVRELCADKTNGFFEFVKEFWHVVIPETPVWNWHIKYICYEFQIDCERVFLGLPKLYDTICNISPGTTKSTIISVMGPAYIHSREPSMRVIAGSHTQLLTFELGRKCRMVEESELYRAAFPAVIPSKDQWTKSLFMNTAGGGRMACTVGGMSPTGFHAHFLLIDDPLDPQQAKKVTETEIDAANNFMSEVLPSRKVNKEVTVTWLIMQRLHQNDCTGYLLAKNKGTIRHICLPAMKTKDIKPKKLRKKYKQGLMDPERLSKKVLKEARNDLGEFGFAGQYGQTPIPKGGGMFKVQRIQLDIAPLHSSKQWVMMCRFWDKAGTAGGGAYTVGMLLGRWRPVGGNKDGSDDQWWILDVVRDQLDSAEREKLIVNTAKKDGRKVIIGLEQEPGSGGKESAQASVKRLAGFKCRVVPAVGSKEERADEWSSMINAEAFKMKIAEWNSTLLDELKHFPHSKYKDQIDAGAGSYTILATPVKKVGAM